MNQYATLLAGLVAALPAIITLCRIVEPFAAEALMSRLPKNRRNQVEDLVNAVVNATEQSRQNTDGKEKKAAASDAVATLAKQLGLAKYASPALVNTLIEAAVYEMNQYSTSRSALPDAGSQSPVSDTSETVPAL